MNKYKLVGKVAVELLKIAAGAVGVSAGAYGLLYGKKNFEKIIDGKGESGDLAEGGVMIAFGAINLVEFGTLLIETLTK